MEAHTHKIHSRVDQLVCIFPETALTVCPFPKWLFIPNLVMYYVAPQDPAMVVLRASIYVYFGSENTLESNS